MNKAKTGKHSEIFNYWKAKCIDKYGYVRDDDNIYNYDDTVEVVEDWGEPQCWACGTNILAEKNPKYDEWLANDDFDKIWNCKEVTSSLQKAHIVPEANGGKSTPDNLFLLCAKCHRESPDIINKNMFFSWVYEKRKNPPHPSECVYKANKILLKNYNIGIPFYDSLEEILSFDKVNTHGFTLMDSTIVYAFVMNALKNKTRLRWDAEMMFEKAILDKIKSIGDEQIQ